jgi:hypothetical protein
VGFSLAFYLTNQWVLAAGLLVTFLVAGEVGWRVGHGGRIEDDALRSLVGGVAAATLGLLGLLLGFTLSMAISRYDARRAVIVEEANAIGTLWLRAGLLDEPLESELRGTLRDYTAARVDLGRVGADLGHLRAARQRSATLQGAIWSMVERAAQPGLSPAVASSLIAAANEVIDVDELRTSSLENYVPAHIILLLVGVASVALAFFGWSFGAAAQRSTTSMVALAFLLTAVLTVIMDLNRPHRGMIRVGDESLVRLQKSIAAAPTNL